MISERKGKRRRVEERGEGEGGREGGVLIVMKKLDIYKGPLSEKHLRHQYAFNDHDEMRNKRLNTPHFIALALGFPLFGLTATFIDALINTLSFSLTTILHKICAMGIQKKIPILP